MKPSALTIACCLAVFLAAIGATVRSLGIPPFLAISCLAVVMVVRQRRIRYIAVLVPFVALSCGLVAANAWLKSTSADDFTRVFATKILFCNHLQIALRSPTVLTTVSGFGQNSKEILSEIESLYAENRADQRVLEYHVEPCLFGRHLDDLLIEGAGISRNGLPELYRLLFWQTVSGNPLDYLTKVGRQMIYGTVMSWPPHGLEPVIAGSPPARDRTIEILQQNGFDTRELVAGPDFVETWFLSRQAFSNHFFRGFSLVFFVAIFSIPILWFVRDRIDRRRLWQLLSATLIWFSNLMAVAASNTLDVWRYIVPTTPIATLILALSLSLWMQAVSRKPTNTVPNSS